MYNPQNFLCKTKDTQEKTLLDTMRHEWHKMAKQKCFRLLVAICYGFKAYISSGDLIGRTLILFRIHFHLCSRMQASDMPKLVHRVLNYI